MKKTRKIVSLLLTLVLVFSFASQTFATTSLPSISSSKPISSYTINSSGKVYAYTASNLKTKTGGYIACATDECKILKISGNAVQVKYPVSGGTKTAWFSRSAFTGYDISKGAAEKWTQANKVTTYRRSDGKTSYGYISANDVCYKLAAKGSYTQVVYPVSGGYKMGWVKTSGIKAVSQGTTTTLTGVPSAPVITSATANSTSSISVKWNAVSGAASYKLYRRKSGDSEYTCIKTGITSTSYSDSGLSAGTKYWYRVYAVNSNNAASVRSESFDGWTKPATPVISDVNAVSDSKLTVKWNAVTGAKSYLVYRRKSGTSDGIANYTKIAATSATSYTDSGLEANTKYWYSVYAVTEQSDSAGVAATSSAATGKDGTTLKKSQTAVTAKSISGATVSAIKNQIYTGKAVKPSANADFTVKDGSATLKNGTDFSLSYKNNTNIGNATVVITGKGNYSGNKSVNFQIVPAAPSISSIKSSGLQQMTVKGTASKGATQYQFMYSVNSNLSGATKTSREDPSAVINKLTTGKTYYVAVRACKTIGEQFYWSAWSGTKKVTIAKVANTVSFSNSNIKSNIITLNKSTAAQSFSLGAKANGGAKLSYSSNNKSVAVNSTGKVTVAKNFSGTAKITATAAATNDYNKASAAITVQVNAAKLPTAIYLKQQGSNTCTLTSAAMMLRARKYLSGKAYSSITESSIKSTAWSGGLKWSWKYSGITVAHKSVSGISASGLKSILNAHPEGVVLYCGKYPHAVFLTDYSGDTFYCADPYGNYSKKRITLSASLLGKKYGSQNKVLKNVTAYWYVSKY